MSKPAIGLWARAGLLAGLAFVPVLMWWSTGLGEYQSINPETGGGTGVNVLGASLGTVLVFFLLPWVLGMSSDDDGLTMKQVGAILLAHFLFLALADHGDRPHYHWMQIFSVASVLIWPPLLCLHLARFPWSAQCARWLMAAGSWAFLLVVSGFVAFLPGHWGGWRFTNALVAHAHLAMAGLLTCLCVLALRGINRQTGLPHVFSHRLGFYLWHGGLALQLVALIALGAAEARRPDLLFGGDPGVDLAYFVRFVAGFCMWGASVAWLRQALGVKARVGERRFDERWVPALEGRSHVTAVPAISAKASP